MAWDFTTEPEFQAKLDWVTSFVEDKVYKVDVLWPHDNYKPAKDLTEEQRNVIQPLKDEVRKQGLWACHLGPELGGQGYGQLKLAMLNEILGKSVWGPRIFGTQAPDNGNAEILEPFGTEEQKTRYLAPRMSAAIVNCFTSSESQAGADPGVFATTGTGDG